MTRGSNHSGPNSGPNSFHGVPDAADPIEAATRHDTSDHVSPFTGADVEDEEGTGRARSPIPGGLVRGVSILGQHIDSLSAPMPLGMGSKGVSHRDMTRSNTNSARTSLAAAKVAMAGDDNV